ncbi:MAG: acyltransferase [Bacteroidetes bacterium]|nr:acyltransferase [Bacteroidota bacterium]
MKPPKVESIQQQFVGGGTFHKYRGITTGHDRGIGFFFLNELLIMISTSFPGAAGYKLRRLGYSLLCAGLGSDVKIGTECSLRRPQYISMEDGTILGDKISLDVKHHGRGIVIGKNVVIGHSTVFSCPGGKIVIGDGTVIGEYCRLGSLEGLILGNNVKVGAYSYIVGAGHDYSSLDTPIIKQSVVCKGPNTIGNDVVIGERVTILDGVEIGPGAHIADDSLVNRDVPEGGLVSGVPAQIKV